MSDSTHWKMRTMTRSLLTCLQCMIERAPFDTVPLHADTHPDKIGVAFEYTLRMLRRVRLTWNVARSGSIVANLR